MTARRPSEACLAQHGKKTARTQHIAAERGAAAAAANSLGLQVVKIPATDAVGEGIPLITGECQGRTIRTFRVPKDDRIAAGGDLDAVATVA